ncbi:MAG: patatin family protein [Solobacterium sp.]|jgi:predicted patatin/cPLA2 family phospholipase|nr:patatin family protein [Solobacterium sp.]MCH4049558.1 patatin family protein [Solobacterium sp.]MCH4073242.1 patatin family protein [Solobacterium sp.]MCI1314126.1 patatin family protein [Solobacterium sp.]MCI1347162.1 patatin family protein [Solobacterium sp.]
MERKGLILEGGAMRGLFTAGVIDEMMAQGVKYDGCIGVSAGAAFGCNYKSHQIGRVLRYNKRFAHEKKYCSWYSWLKTGDLYGADFCYHKLPNELDVMDVKTYNSDPMHFYVTATDTASGKPVYHELDHLDDEAYEWMRASASMPVVSKPVRLMGRSLLDGGISDSIPVAFFESIGYTRNVVVLTQPRGYRKGMQSGMKVLARLLKQYPAIVEDLKERHIVYNRELDYIDLKEKEGKLFVIAPPHELKIGKTEHDTERMDEVYQIGRQTMKGHISELNQFLNRD